MQISMMIRMVYAISESMPGLINGIRMIVRSATGGAVTMTKRLGNPVLGEVLALYYSLLMLLKHFLSSVPSLDISLIGVSDPY